MTINIHLQTIILLLIINIVLHIHFVTCKKVIFKKISLEHFYWKLDLEVIINGKNYNFKKIIH